MNGDFDAWIERELGTAFARAGAAVPEPRYRTQSSRLPLGLRRLLPVVLGGKLAAGVAITCLAAASTVAATTVLTGNADPFTLIHHSSAPASSPDATARPAVPGDRGSSSLHGPGRTPASPGVAQNGDGVDPAHAAGAAAGRGGDGKPSPDANSHPVGDAPATPPGQGGLRGDGAGSANGTARSGPHTVRWRVDQHAP